MEFIQKHMQIQLSLLLLLCFSLFHFRSSVFTPPDNYLFDCGSTSNTIVDNRNFISDHDFFLPSATQTISLRDPNPLSDSSPLYHTARIFTKPSSYEFKINSNGTHMVRFHFFPFSAEGYDLHSSVFNVFALEFMLLSNFSVPNKTQVVKEYIIRADAEKLVISFMPSSSSSIAFVNAIEVFSVPGNLIGGTPKYVSTKGFKNFGSLSEQRLETVHRINVGGPKITPYNDTLWRIWLPDDDFLLLDSSAMSINFTGQIRYQSYNSQIAPDSVYNTARVMNKMNIIDPNFNLTWVFQVDSDYKYLIRMHFCDIISQSAQSTTQLYFDVYINDYFADEDLHPSEITFRTLAAPFYRDYVADPDSKGMIRVSVGPSAMSSPSKKNATLNGLEIMKINNSMGGLDGVVSANSNLGSGSKKKFPVVILIATILGGLAIIASLISIWVLVAKCLKRKKPIETAIEFTPMPLDGGNSYTFGTYQAEGSTPSPSPSVNPGLQISLADLMLATNNFDKDYIIGSGGFGKVYRGVLRDGTKVAVKRKMPGSRQGLPEFYNEIMVLTRIRHRHLVSLIGYCEEQSEMILVSEFMEKGPLNKHLYGSDLPCLSWTQRLEICIGSARGLHYLHTGSSQRIIHRDVKSSNILLDEDYVAKVADFGLSKFGPSLNETHVSTTVKGSFGYLDPEYYKRLQLTEKSDIYSFGVVLLEVLCARPVIDSTLSSEQENLAQWALHWQKRGLLEQIVDPRIVDQINSNSLRNYGETAEKCLAEFGVDRPAISDVLWNLEYALQLQVTAMQRQPYEDSSTCVSAMPLPIVQSAPSSRIRMDGADVAEMSDEQLDINTSQVFSQLITREGR